MDPEIIDFVPPSKTEMELLLKLHDFYFSPQYFGLNYIQSDKPSLYVGNHSIYGVIDSPLIVNAIYQKTGMFPRCLGDRAHFDIPYWNDLVTKFGVVMGSRENCAELMKRGDNIVVFPGGSREVAKRKGEEHKLYWKQRTGFARMAIKYGYQIVPFGVVGCDDAYNILFDGEELKSSWLGKRLLKNDFVRDITRNGDLFFPIARGSGLTGLLPKPERFYIGFGEMVDTSVFSGKEDVRGAQLEVREQTADSIEDIIEELQEIQGKDTDKSFIRKLLTRKKS